MQKDDWAKYRATDAARNGVHDVAELSPPGTDAILKSAYREWHASGVKAAAERRAKRIERKRRSS
jgi:hypothetical protein